MTDLDSFRFNVRVYGVLINDRNEVLVTDEKQQDFSFTKFPGGGLEWGEGIKDCLYREFKEEFEIEIKILNLFYLTDHFVQSAWKKTDQLISVYYLVKQICDSPLKIKEKNVAFRFIPVEALSKDDFTFPIDKIVAEKLGLMP